MYINECIQHTTDCTFHQARHGRNGLPFKTTRSHSQSHIYLKDGLVILHSSEYLGRNCDLCVQLSTFYLNVHALVKIHIDALYYINIKQLHFFTVITEH